MQLEAKSLLYDMQQAISLIYEFTRNTDFADYECNAMMRSAGRASTRDCRGSRRQPLGLICLTNKAGYILIGTPSQSATCIARNRARKTKPQVTLKPKFRARGCASLLR